MSKGMIITEAVLPGKHRKRLGNDKKTLDFCLRGNPVFTDFTGNLRKNYSRPSRHRL